MIVKETTLKDYESLHDWREYKVAEWKCYFCKKYDSIDKMKIVRIITHNEIFGWFCNDICMNLWILKQ